MNECCEKCHSRGIPAVTAACLDCPCHEVSSLTGEDGKLFSRVVAKAFEAPFPEVAVQHAIRRVAEKYKKEGFEQCKKQILEKFPNRFGTSPFAGTFHRGKKEGWNMCLGQIKEIITSLQP